MAQYLDETGLQYMVGKLNDKVQLLIEDEFNDQNISAEEFCAVRKRPPAEEYFNLKALAAGDITITIPADVTQHHFASLAYSKDKTNWTTTVNTTSAITITIPMNAGEIVYLKGSGSQTSAGATKGVNINSSMNIVAAGNTMSLLYEDDFIDKTTFPTMLGADAGYHCALFQNNTHLVDAHDMVLPATTLGTSCYYNMFRGCTNLINAPAEIPATTIADSSCRQMFMSCTNLKSAPALPATTLGTSCYYSMFYQCTSLTTAPVLPAATLTNSCYRMMFMGCSNINSITILATDVSATACMANFAVGVSSTGTLTKKTGVTLPAATGSNGTGIPSSWTVVEV